MTNRVSPYALLYLAAGLGACSGRVSARPGAGAGDSGATTQGIDGSSTEANGDAAPTPQGGMPQPADGGGATADAEAGDVTDGAPPEDAGSANPPTDPDASAPPVTGPTAPNAPVTATLYVDSVAYNLAPEFSGQNYVGWSFWGADTSQSSFQKSFLTEAGVQTLRYPGGTPSMYMDLLTSTSSQSAGAPLFTTLWSSFAPGGLKSMLLETNPTGQFANPPNDEDSSGARAATIAKAAASAGIDAMYEVANEPDIAYYPKNGGQTAYIKNFIEHATAIHAAVPGAKVYGPVTCGFGGNCSFPVTWDSGWIGAFLRETGDKASGPGKGTADGISFHVYLHPEWDYSDLSQAKTDLYGFAQYWPQTMMPYIRNEIAKYDSRDLPVMISEVSLTTGGSTGNGHMSEVLRTLDLVGAFAFSGVHSFQWFDANQDGGNDWATVTTSATRPVFYSFFGWSQMGPHVLNYDSTVNPHDVAIYGTSKNDGSVQALLINKTNSPHAISLKFRGFDPTGKPMKLFSINSSDGTDTSATVVVNGSNNPAPTAIPAAKTSVAESVPIVTVPPFSIAVVSIGG